jgi:hypothetical protein
MGLFSKLFSREGEEPTESEGGQETQATQPGGEDGVKKSDESGPGGGSPKDSRARPGGADKVEAAPPPASADKQARARTEAGMGGQQPASPKKPAPPLDASDAAKKKNDPKAAAAAAKPPPQALGATAARAPQAPAAPPPAAAEAAAPAARRGIGGAARPTGEVAVSAKIIGTVPATLTGEPAANSARDTGGMQLDAAVDAAMAALIDTGSQPAAASEHHHAADQRAVTETFADMAKVHAHPLRELMFQLSVGRTPRHWAAACRPVLRPLFDGATQIGMLELVGALGAFDAALERAAGEPNAFIGNAAGDALNGAYERLRQQMPDAFTHPDRADSRRLILLESLLLQIPDMHRRTLAKLYAAGLSSLGQLGTANAEEISVVAGVDRGLAENIVDHVQRFEQERSRVDPTSMRGHVQDRLRSILGRLAQLQSEFERAEESDSAAGKRSARQKREAAVLELDLVFAEVGDVDVIEELKRCPVRGKIQRVESYLERMQASA